MAVKRTWGALMVLTVLAGCGVVEPEPFVPTAAPRETLTPTASPTPTSTPTPTATSTPQPSPTRSAPTAVFGPSATPSDGVPSPTRSAEAPAVEYLVTSNDEVSPGDSVTLFWSATGVEQATIYRLNAEGEREQFWVVQPRGRLVVATRVTDRDMARFALVVGEDDHEVEQIINLPLVGCAEPWFFEPAPDVCSAGAPLYSGAADQPFEHGRMIWLEAERRIYVLYSDDQSPAWQAFDDVFVEGETPESAPEFDNPPEGLLQPVRGFGLVWRSQEQVRARLGWATLPEASFDEGAMQADLGEEGSSLYLRSVEGAILVLAPDGAAWQVLEQ